ncbi:hypothetical protein J3R74_000551 [Puniceicoccus vermicola]
MSAKYDLNVGKNLKILRPQFEQNYDVKKSAYTLTTEKQGVGVEKLNKPHNLFNLACDQSASLWLACGVISCPVAPS